MWKFLHKFRIHHWTKWYWDTIGMYPEEKLFIHIYQGRLCLICKKQEVKLVKKKPVRV
jgi:hypothetical protein